MLKMLKQFFHMFTVLFEAGEKLANATNELASVAEDGAGIYADRVRAEREQANSDFMAKLEQQRKEQAKANRAAAKPKAVPKAA